MKTRSRSDESQQSKELWCLHIGRTHLNEERFLTLAVIDPFTRMSLETRFHKARNGKDVVQALDRLVSRRSAPVQLHVSHDLFFREEELARWAFDHGTKIVLR